MTTPPQPPEGNDNPYGQDPAGQPPYGQPAYGQPPYGATPYGGPAYDGRPAVGTDGVSIAALVTGLVCCAPVNIILGIIGIRRTKDGVRKGRWMAVTGLVLGVLSVFVWIGLVAGGVWIFNNVVTPDNAEVGQCVDVDRDGSSVSMLKRDCDDDHDAEIVAVEELDEQSAEDAEAAQVAYCDQLLDPADLETIRGRDDVELQAVFEDPDDVEDGDHIVCYVEATRGTLDERILD